MVSIVKVCKLELGLCVFILNWALRVPLSYPWLNLLDNQIIQGEWKVVVHLSEIGCNESTVLVVTISVGSGPTGVWKRPCVLPKVFLYGISPLPSQYADFLLTHYVYWIIVKNVYVGILGTEWLISSSGLPRNFVRLGVQQIQLRTEDRENGDMGAVAPSQGFWRQL